MKKVLSIMFMFSLFLVCIISVRAEKYNCAYKFKLPSGWCDAEKEETATITFDEDNELIFSKDILSHAAMYIDDSIAGELTMKSTLEKYKGKCPGKVYGCLAKTKNVNWHDIIGLIFNPELYEKMKTPITVGASKQNEIKKKDDCNLGELIESESDKPAEENQFECSFYDSYIGENGYLKKNYCKLGDGGCTTDKIVEYKRKKEELVATCRQYLQNGDYFNQCVKKCINLPDDIASIEGKKATNPCGFSGKLYYWIQNIMKWIKYILPVIVIIFGILDFIKAMANESDEEMKKSQKRFVIRLISAALVFLVPLIIQFVLEKMGFNANACGLW